MNHVICTKILPYFGNHKIAEIEVKDIIAWQNELIAYRDEKGKSYSADSLDKDTLANSKKRC